MYVVKESGRVKNSSGFIIGYIEDRIVKNKGGSTIGYFDMNRIRNCTESTFGYFEGVWRQSKIN
jgi:hypothetical protein